MNEEITEPYPDYIGRIFYTHNNGNNKNGIGTECLSWDYIPSCSCLPDGWNRWDLVLYLGDFKFLWIQKNVKRILYHRPSCWAHFFVSVEELQEDDYGVWTM